MNRPDHGFRIEDLHFLVRIFMRIGREFLVNCVQVMLDDYLARIGKDIDNYANLGYQLMRIKEEKANALFDSLSDAVGMI